MKIWDTYGPYRGFFYPTSSKSASYPQIESGSSTRITGFDMLSV